MPPAPRLAASLSARHHCDQAIEHLSNERQKMTKTLRCAAPALILLMTLSGCATAPMSQQPCPVVQQPPPPAPVPLGPSFTDRMRIFLSGNLPEQKNSD